MPNINGTGPRGEGSKTGRGLGKCGTGQKVDNGQDFKSDQSRGLGLGLRQGRGRGRGKGLGLRGGR